MVCILKRCRDSYSNKVVASVVISVYYMCCHPQFSYVGSSSSSRALRTVMTPSGGGLSSGWWGRNRPAGASLQPPPAGTPDRSSRTKSPTFRGEKSPANPSLVRFSASVGGETRTRGPYQKGREIFDDGVVPNNYIEALNWYFQSQHFDNSLALLNLATYFINHMVRFRGEN